MNDVISHKCPNCDGPLLFDPKEQDFHCEFCLSRFSESDIKDFEKQNAPQVHEEQDVTPEVDSTEPTYEESSSDTVQDTLSDEPEEMSLFNCPSCGAEIVTESTTAATYCYYCHNPVVLAGRLNGKYLPESVLPFKIEEKEAVSAFLEWGRKKYFIPKDFFSNSQVEKLTGVYFPYWVTNADLKGELEAEANSISVWHMGDYEYTQTKKYRLYRKGNMSFRALVKNALNKNSSVTMVESVQPFPIDDAIPFKSQYLSGFQAEKRDIEYEDLAGTIQDELKNYAGATLSDTVHGYTTVYNKKMRSSIQSDDQHYVLLPVWLLTYKNQDNPSLEEKPFYYAMNGYTGKISGKLPVDKVKLALASIGLGTLVAGLVMLGGYML